jgi:hypothetical protein
MVAVCGCQELAARGWRLVGRVGPSRLTMNPISPREFGFLLDAFGHLPRHRPGVPSFRLDVPRPLLEHFHPNETPVSEPFAIFAYGPDDHVAYLPFAGLSRGHSLGSTLAILLARLACYAGISVTKILHDNQGSPKGGREVQGVLRRPGSADLAAGEHL